MVLASAEAGVDFGVGGDLTGSGVDDEQPERTSAMANAAPMIAQRRFIGVSSRGIVWVLRRSCRQITVDHHAE